MKPKKSKKISAKILIPLLILVTIIAIFSSSFFNDPFLFHNGYTKNSLIKKVLKISDDINPLVFLNQDLLTSLDQIELVLSPKDLIHLKISFLLQVF